MTFLVRTLLLSIACLPVYGQNLSPKLQHAHARLGDELQLFSVRVHNPERFVARYYAQIKIEGRKEKTFHVRARSQWFVSELTTDDNILFADILHQPTTEAGVDFVNFAFNRITTLHHLYPSLDGSDQKVSIKENNFDKENIDLIDRSFETVLTPPTISQHATTMATLIAGGGNSSLKGLGVAPAAEITASNFNNLLPDPDEVFTNNNIHIQNHSYGVQIENYYGNEAEAYDDQMRTHPTLVHVFSAGNLGSEKPGHGIYKDLPYANLSGNFKQAKNVLLTTAVDTSFAVNQLNSKGPAYDGRLKPELAAYGQGGTSDAAALVSGTCALVQQQYKHLHGTLPLSSTVKATLIAAADDVGPEGIDFTYGYGNMNASKAIQLLNAGNTHEVVVASNDVINIQIAVEENVALLKVAVAWIDPPATQANSPALVHDIDCTLSDGTIDHLPWVLNDYPNVDSLSAIAKRKADHVNNVEYFTIENPTTGTYTLSIYAPVLTTDGQPVSVAYWQEKKTFTFDFPRATDVLEANQKHTLFWQSAIEEHGDLYFQLNDGDWQLLQSNVDLTKPQRWKTPDTLAIGKLKMVIADVTYLSDAFTISPTLKVNVAFNCDDEFSLSWKRIEGASDYHVYSLSEKYLEEVLTTTDTTVVFPKAERVFYAVAPSINSNKGLRSQTINYEEQGAFCYINLFSAQRFEPDRITLQLKLSTIINVETIRIFKVFADGEELLLTTTPTATQYEFFDTELTPGTVQYRAELTLNEGNAHPSATTEILVEKKDRATLFPNPVSHAETLSVVTEGNGVTFEIINEMGQLIFTTQLDLTTEVIEIKNFPAGIYLYILRRHNRTIDSGRIIKY